MSIPVVTIGAGQAELVGSLERLHGPVTVVRRCSELAELVAACQTGLARAAVVAGGTAEVTATLSDRLAAVGVGLIGLTDDAAERERLGGLGILAAAEAIEAADLASLISEAVEEAARRTRGGLSSSFGLAGVRPDVQSLAPEPDAVPEPDRQGEILAVWGPIGSPGRTTIAVNCAAELAAAGQSVILVDADTYGASVAGVLGLLDDSAGLAQACRLADQGLLDSSALERVATPVVIAGGTVRVLTGLTRADRWPELRAAAFAMVLERCRAAAETVVVDVGFCLEADEELSFDTMAPRRNGTTLRALELADRVLAVGAADSVAMPRLVRALAELDSAVPGCAPAVVFNRVRSSAVGRFPERALRDAWERFGPGLPIAAMLPHDAAAADAALLNGQVLLECAPDSALRQAITALVCAPGQRSSRFAGRRARPLAKLPR
ncbi:AAA family ATPase [Sinomonas cellulolyticus]|uniref:Chromosome partitioning protein n=1 Tax=Sinomonas cellulolyticus TaxID=2801916 RepID=A0ABS1JZQ1_9MICC|nr:MULTISPECIES: P-loop NTPase [Sinomonas]MBL0704895.1 chromosome partitioning protein [Sinomonas cellulolyticus]